MPDAYLRCHEVAHRWDTDSEEGRRVHIHRRVGKTVEEVRRELKCDRCGTLRITVYDYRNGDVLEQKYKPAEGYYAVNDGSPALSKADYRYTVFRRAPLVDG
jgi:hypothetical protein